MVDSIGRFSLGRSAMTGKKKRDFLQKTIRKMEQWRDKARINIIQQRERYKRKIALNRALMKAKKAGKIPNLNPSSYLSDRELGFQPRSIHRFQATHSTVPSKPRYSIVKPAERIYGNKWETDRRGKKKGDEKWQTHRMKSD